VLQGSQHLPILLVPAQARSQCAMMKLLIKSQVQQHHACGMAAAFFHSLTASNGYCYGCTRNWAKWSQNSIQSLLSFEVTFVPAPNGLTLNMKLLTRMRSQGHHPFWSNRHYSCHITDGVQFETNNPHQWLHKQPSSCTFWLMAYCLCKLCKLAVALFAWWLTLNLCFSFHERIAFYEQGTVALLDW